MVHKLPPGIDQSVKRDLELKSDRFALDDEVARQLGLQCRDCDSKKLVYFISVPVLGVFDAGAYCYKCLFNRCLKGKAIPLPIPADLLDALQADIKAARDHAIQKFYGG